MGVSVSSGSVKSSTREPTWIRVIAVLLGRGAGGQARQEADEGDGQTRGLLTARHHKAGWLAILLGGKESVSGRRRRAPGAALAPQGQINRRARQAHSPRRHAA
ncbi:hypothetical protein GCM10010449_12800 [Streptomyces rectiviolaceus]|uniref:Uncharacterized protein n=1 Tax=Streptomyces rectiviolaceus TaxID=332591 RepID=A0ABP6MAX8_9ACTN